MTCPQTFPGISACSSANVWWVAFNDHYTIGSMLRDIRPKEIKVQKKQQQQYSKWPSPKECVFCVIGHLLTASSRELWDIGTSVAMSGLSPRYYLLLWCSCLSEVSSLEIRKPWWKTVRDNLFVESLSGVAGAGPGQAGPVQSVFIVMSWNALLLIISRLQRVIL